MTITLNRRALDASLCAVSVALIATEVGACNLKLETPVMALFRQWRALSDRLNGDAPITEKEMEAGCRELGRLEDEMCALPSENAEDHMVKLIALTSWGNFTLRKDDKRAFWVEARALMRI